MRLLRPALLLVLASPAAAQLTAFTDQTLWLIAAGTPTATETFDSYLADENFNDIAVSIGTGTMEAIGGSSQLFRNVIDVPPFQYEDINGTPCVSAFVNGPSTTLPGIEIHFELGGPASAFAFDYDTGSWFEGLTLEFQQGGATVGSIVMDGVFPVLGFLGLASAQTFDRVIMKPTTPMPGFGGEGFTLDNVALVGGSGPGGVGVRYCSPASPNSTGQPGSILAAGSAIAAANTLSLAALSLPASSFGFFLASQTQGLITTPGGSQGDLCLGGGIGRYVGPGQILNSGSMGTFSLALDLTQTPQPQGFVAASAGQTWNFQAWHRDSVGGLATSNFTDAVSITLQ